MKLSPVSYYRIDATEVPLELLKESGDPEPLVPVTPKSPLHLRREVERIGYCFKRELGFDFPPFEATERGPYSIYLITSLPHHSPAVFAGACGFRMREWRDIGPRNTLTFVWLHPYWRGAGVLAAVWPELRKGEGDFFLDLPVSPAMTRFVKRHYSDSTFFKLLDKRPR